MQPDIYLGTLRISEPVIMLTGLGIALICGYASLRLLRRQETAPAYRWMIRFFALMTVSSVLGPFLGHAFTYWAGFPGKYACWIFSILSLGALSQAAIEHARSFFSMLSYRGLTLLNLLGMSAAVTVAGLTKSFISVEAHSALAVLGFMLPLEGLVYARRRDPGSYLFLQALPITVFSLVPVVLKWSPGIWFTHLDVGHVLLYPYFVLLMLGAERMQHCSGTANIASSYFPPG